jgi:hypothetical protein
MTEEHAKTPRFSISRSSHLSHFYYVLAGWLLLVSAARAASPRDELLRLVPEDVGFCLVIEDIRGHGTALLASPFFKQFRSSPTAAKIVDSPETKKLSEIDQFLARNLHITSIQLRDEIIGDELVLAYRPGPPGKPQDEEGLFLLHARNPKLLAELLDRINEIQKQSGDLEKIEERVHAGRKYFLRLDSKSASFYYLRGPLLAFSTREGILKQLVDRDVQSSGETESPISRQFRLLNVSNPLLALWINPRSFEPALEERISAASGAQAVALKNLLAYWKAIEGIGVTVGLESDLELSISVRAKLEKLPASARRFLQTAAVPSELWTRFPDDALFAMAGRLDVAAFVDACGEFVAEEARAPFRAAIEQSLGAIVGTDVVTGLVPYLGPDFGICAMAPAENDKSWVPNVIAALRVRPGERGMAPEIALSNAVNSLATLLVFTQNSGRPGSLKLHAASQDDIEVKYLVDDERFPPGFQPTFAIKDRYALFASSPQAIRQFRKPSAPVGSALAQESPLIRVSLKGISKYLEQHRSDLIKHSAVHKQIAEEQAAHGLDNLVAGLKLFDRVELVQQPGPDRATLTLRLRMSQPLK